MISGSLAVEGPPRGLGLTVPGHHLQHPPLPFVAYHQQQSVHHHQLHHIPSSSGSTWGVRAMVTSQPPPPSVAVSLSQQTAAQQHKQHAEFLMPLPKPLNNRYNSTSTSSGGSTTTNGLRLPNSRVPKYSPPAASVAPNTVPVNLVQHKDEASTQEELYQNNVAAYAARMLHVPQNFSYAPNPYNHPLYPPPYTPLLSHNSPLDSSTFMSRYNPSNRVNIAPSNIPSAAASTPVTPKSPKDKKPSATVTSETFKVPSGKEGSLKHRILTRPSGSSAVSSESVNVKKQVSPTTSQQNNSVMRTINNNTTIPVGFGRDSLIRLATGELKRVEDMRTEDFVKSAQQCPELRLADSTVVRIDENQRTGTARITLSYNQNRTQVEIETILEHPLFIYGQGWASCTPDRTLQLFGLKCHRLQVGDICITLMPRENTTPISTPTNSNFKLSGTITTTATTTAMTSRQISPKTTTSSTYPPRTHSAEEVAAIEASNARKRRWSAPDQICEEEKAQRRLRE